MLLQLAYIRPMTLGELAYLSLKNNEGCRQNRQMLWKVLEFELESILLITQPWLTLVVQSQRK